MLGRKRDLARKSRGPLFGLTAGLIALWLGAGWLLALGVVVFVGVIAGTWGTRLSSADQQFDAYGHHGYGHHHVSGWMGDGGDGFDGGGFDGGGGGGGGDGG